MKYKLPMNRSFKIIIQQSPGCKIYKDLTNDLSRQYITADYSAAENIPFYINNVLVYKNEPDPSSDSSSSSFSLSSTSSSSTSSSTEL